MDDDHAAVLGIVEQPTFPLINDGEDRLMVPEAGFDIAQWRARAVALAAHQRLLGLLHHELATHAIFLSISASYANHALAHPEHSLLLRQKCRQFFPSNCVSLTSVLSMVTQSPIENAVVDSTMELLARMRLAETCLKSPDVEDGDAELAALASQLSSLCLDYVNIHRELAAALDSTGQCGTRPAPSLVSAERLAFVAAHGGWPCLDETGGVSVPGWFERRDNARFKTRIRCQILSDGSPLEAVIEDLSSMGAGLCVAGTLQEGWAIRLLLPNGFCMDGEIKWQNGSRCGIGFSERLSPDQLRLIRAIPVNSASRPDPGHPTPHGSRAQPSSGGVGGPKVP